MSLISKLSLPLCALFLSACATNITAADPKHLEAFPAAKDGMKRVVIQLDQKDREDYNNYRVELVPGAIMMTDGVNLMRHGSSITEHNLEGWGYSYYEVEGNGKALSTMMAAPEGVEKVEAFVGGTPLIIPYNSELPVVIYAPENMEVRYRIWEAPATLSEAQ